MIFEITKYMVNPMRISNITVPTKQDINIILEVSLSEFVIAEI